jgi:hypothetical protein
MSLFATVAIGPHSCYIAVNNWRKQSMMRDFVRYEKRSIQVDAIRFEGTRGNNNANAIERASHGAAWEGTETMRADGQLYPYMQVTTPHGTETLKPNEWLIRYMYGGNTASYQVVSDEIFRAIHMEKP